MDPDDVQPTWIQTDEVDEPIFPSIPKAQTNPLRELRRFPDETPVTTGQSPVNEAKRFALPPPLYFPTPAANPPPNWNALGAIGGDMDPVSPDLGSFHTEDNLLSEEILYSTFSSPPSSERALEDTKHTSTK